MWSTEVGQCIIYSGKIYGQKMISLSKAISVAQCHRWFTSLWPTIRPVRCLLVILGKTLLYYVTLPPMRMSSIFLWPLSVFGPREGHRPCRYGPSFCVPFCLWPLAPLLLAGLNVWVKLLRELNTALLNFFWGGKKDLVAFDVVIHHREDGGFGVVSISWKVYALLAQWIKRLCFSPGFFVKLLVFLPFWRRSPCLFSTPLSLYTRLLPPFSASLLDS